MKEIAKTVEDLDTMPEFAEYHLVQNEDEIEAIKEHFAPSENGSFYSYYWVKIEDGCIVDAYGSLGVSYERYVYSIELN